MAQNKLQIQVERHLAAIYQDGELSNVKNFADELIELMGLSDKEVIENRNINHWDQTDSLVIAYGDSVLAEGEKPLQTLNRFLDKYLRSSISGVHILPFYKVSEVARHRPFGLALSPFLRVLVAHPVHKHQPVAQPQ